MGGRKRKKNKEKEVFFLELEERSMKKIRKRKMEFDNATTPRGIQNLQFNLDQFPGARFLSKLDSKLAFWQLELHPDSHYLTVFHANDKLYQYTRLIMGVKPAQRELNAALKPIFTHIPNVYLIHDDLIIAKNFQQAYISALSELLNSDKHHKWTETHQKVFNNVLDKFKKETLLSYFDISKPTFIFIDAHQSGLSAILAQGSNKDNARPVAFASRCTSKAEKNYVQLDLEVMAVDFALRRFCFYLVGPPNDTIN